MTNVRGYDVAVIGAGIIGASTAYRLARAGARVGLLEAGTPATGASGNSFAWLNSEQKIPDAYHRLNVAGLAEYAALERDLHGIEVHRTGALRWPTTAAEDGTFEHWRQRNAALGYAMRWISRPEVEALEPNVRLPEGMQRALFSDDDAWVHPPDVVRALLDAARPAVELVEGAEVTAIEHTGGAVRSLRTTAGDVTADALVICAGTGTEALAAMLGVSIPVERHPGLILVTTPVPEGTIGRVIHHGLEPDGDVHLRPDVGGGIRLSAAYFDTLVDEHTPVDPPPAFARELIERGAEVVPALASVEIARAHLGVRPVPADGVAVAGRLPGLANVYAIVTHSGVTMGPLLGRLVASEVGGPPDPLLADFRPDRFVTSSARKD